jgi:hypothetical protein
MAVVASREVAKGTGVSGKFGESFVFTRRWLIRVDDPATSRVDIAAHPGVTFGAGHPDSATHVAMEFDCTEASGDGMVWELVVKYYLPPATSTPDPETGIPTDTWQASNSTTTIPVYKDKDDESICNSAGDPLEGVEREANSFTLTLTKFYDGGDNYTWSATAKSQSNTVNESSWNGGDARTWKVEFRSAAKKPLTDGGTAETRYYWETVWEFKYREETWDLKPWDIGFNQLVDSEGNPESNGSLRAAVLGADKKPVKSPVALYSDGTAKPAGEKPDALEFRVYQETNFSATFGTPS